MIPKRSTIITTLLVAFVLWGFGWPLLTIQLNLREGERVKAILLAAVADRFPNVAFQSGVGYTGPNVSITAEGKLSDDDERQIIDFLGSEYDRHRFRVVLSVHTDTDPDGRIVRDDRDKP